jgi:hypothetical protein
MTDQQAKSWWREIIIGLVVAILSAVILAQGGLDRRHEAPLPGASLRSDSYRLVGRWRADTVEGGEPVTYFWTLNANGVSEFVQVGDDEPQVGSWQYSDGAIFERFSNGASGKGLVRWSDENHFELTILDNGVPDNQRLTRSYYHQ